MLGAVKPFSLPVMIARLALGVPILLLPWFFGGVQPRHQLWLAAGVFVALGCYLFAHAAGRITDRPLPVAFVPLILALALGTSQLLPLHPALLSTFSPQANHLWNTLLPSADIDSTAPQPKSEIQHPKSEIVLAHSLGVSASRVGETISLYPASTRYDLSLLVLAVAVFFVGTRLFVDDRVLLVLLVLVAINGAALSFFGLIQQMRWNGLLFGTIPLTEGGVPFASFVNRNNGAGYLNICLAASLGLTVWSFSNPQERKARSYATTPWQKATQFVSDLNAARLFSLALMMLIFGGLVCAMSRGAWVAAIGAAVITVCAAYFTRRTGLGALLLVATLVGGFGLIEWIGKTEAVQQRFQTLLTQGEYPDGRLSHWQDSLATASDFLATGSGLGTYRFIYKMYEQNAAPLWYYHAENQYVEALVEGGIPGLLLMLSMIVLVAVASWRLLHTNMPRLQPTLLSTAQVAGTASSYLQKQASALPKPTREKRVESSAGAPLSDSESQAGASGPARTSPALYFPLGIFGLFAISSQAINSAFDFGLYLPANMALLALISGIVVAYAVRGTRSKGRDSRSQVRGARSASQVLRAAPRSLQTASRLSPITAALLAFAIALCFAEIQSTSRAQAALSGTELADAPDAISLVAVDKQIARLAAVLAARTDDAELHQRSAQLWIYRFRLEALPNLKKRYPEDTDLNWLWSSTSTLRLHASVHQLRRQDLTFHLDELRRASDVQANLPNAVRHLLLARRSCPLLVRTHLLLAETAPAISEHADDRLNLKRARRLAKGSYDSLIECGLLEFQAGRPERACDAWRRAIEIHPKRVGQLLAVARDLVDLEAYIVQLLPASPELLVEVIRQHLVDEMQPSLRQRILQRASELVETTANAQEVENIYLRGAILALSHNYRGAIDQYTLALQLAPRRTAWRFELTQLLQSTGRLDDAQEQVAICVRMEPKNHQYQALQQDILDQAVSREL